ncbi:MAG TPA: malonyl-CoA decarboxylase [Albidovulum sp.]|uniref:malonyl-CoA decarboxylase n=1 Tax=Albidovulum sp. TaxID=1872424 RepID=UPI002D0E650F|nr:malonyl-CoA decarboxylase [Albidovulum sp.]
MAAGKERHFLAELLARTIRVGRSARSDSTPPDLSQLLRAVLADRGEASGLTTASIILDLLEAADDEALLGFFRSLLADFSPDPVPIRALLEQPLDAAAIRSLHFLAEPPSQEVLRRLNRVPGGTARLVALRARLNKLMKEAPDLKPLDQDFRHLFASWFNRGFLEMARINWQTPAEILERIIAYEAVHEIKSWDDLRQRVADPDRRLFAFFHPAMPADPLIFVEVALTAAVPSAIQPILSPDRQRIEPEQAKVAVFYSISNCQEGLKGISFGNFLIKQVVSELSRDLPNLKTFVTLSPVPGLAAWAKAEGLATPDDDDETCRLAARYLTKAKTASGTALDPVAHFHLGNGASLHAIHPRADLSPRAVRTALGVMVNYLYDSARIETNHQAYATKKAITTSPAVTALTRS